VLVDIPREGSLAGKRIGRLLRNSDPKQIGNWSSVEQDEGLAIKIRAEGAEIVPYDEQGTSGRDLSRRRVCLQMLDDVDKRRLQGIAAYDIKRLTRNEFGIDGGIIARRLIEARAVLITFSKTYELWKEDDLLQFQFQCMIAGIDIRGKKKELWRGIFGRASHECFFLTYPPRGYANRIVETTNHLGRAVLRKYPMKDEDQRPMMEAIVDAFERAGSLGQAARMLNVGGHQRRGRKGRYKNQVLPWKTGDLHEMLTNPIYEGRWEFGRTSDKRNTVWEGFLDRTFTHDVPDLAWWTPEQGRRWRRKFSERSTGGAKPSRTRKYEYLLKGVLSCAGCGKPLISGGADRKGEVRYLCQYRTDKTVCPNPQIIHEGAAFRALRGAMPSIVEQWGRASEAVRRTKQDDSKAEEMRASLDVKREQLAALKRDYMALPTPRPQTLALEMVEKEQEIAALLERLEAEEQRALEAASVVREQEMLVQTKDVMWALDAPEARPHQAAIMRALLRDVVIDAAGWASGRTHEVRSWAYRHGSVHNADDACRILAKACSELSMVA
jgi:hypothetical protein